MKVYWVLEKALYPSLRFSQYHYYETLKRVIPQSCDWLDLGCGHQMFASWMARQEQELTQRSRKLMGIDVDWEGLKQNTILSGRVLGNLEALPFHSTSFDVATANMVVEHLQDPDAVLREVHRVLRPGGLFIFHTPNVRSVATRISSHLPQVLKTQLAGLLEGREETDVFPTCYRMNTMAAITRSAKANGFGVQELFSISSSAMTALLGPVAVIELLYLRLLETSWLHRYRSNLIGVIRKE
jgi:ubiquinone/menaquinone biosynthesis C-methylase UbiE